MTFAFLSSFAHLALENRPTGVSGGAELQIALLARELVRKGHEVTVIGTENGQRDHGNLQGVYTRIGGRYHEGDLAGTASSFLQTYKLVRELQPDYVGIMGAGSWVFFLWLMRTFGLPFRLIFIAGSDIDTNGDYRKANPAKGFLYEFALRRCDFRFAMTRDQADGFTRMRLPHGLYRNLVPESGHPSPRASAKNIDFLWVSSAQELKHPERFLELARLLPNHRFTMICPVKNDPGLWSRISTEARTIPNLHYIDWVPYNEIQRYFHRAQVFVNTSDYEGYPNTFVQSGLGAAALLSLRVDPDGALSRHGAGICANGDWDLLVASARRFMTEPALLAQCQQKALGLVAQWHDNATNCSAFLRELGEETARPQPVHQS